MIRISHDEITERWALTYAEDGYQVRAAHVNGLKAPPEIDDVTPDIEAEKGHDRILVQVIESCEALDAPQMRHSLEVLEHARASGVRLHLIVAAECLAGFKDKMDDWHIHPDTVHVT